MLQGVLFDLGGTLYSYAGLQDINRQVLAKLAQELEFEQSFDEVLRHHREANLVADRHFATVPGYLYRDYFRTIFRQLLTNLGRAHQEHHFDWFEDYQRVMLLNQMSLKSDCHATLSALKSRGLYLSIVSNADENMLHPLMSRANLKPHFDHYTSSEAAQSCKPDRRFFELAIAKSGRKPSELLFIGDSLEQDIAGAQRVGLKTVLITEFDGPAPMHLGGSNIEPDFRIRQLSELLPIVDRLRA